jgi:hypothetical protein
MRDVDIQVISVLIFYVMLSGLLFQVARVMKLPLRPQLANRL